MRTVKIIDLHPGQQKARDMIKDAGAKWNIMVCGRQWGKTLFSSAQMTAWMMSNPNSKGIWISPFTAQSEQIYFEMVQRCGAFIKSSNSQNKRIVWFNNSILVFKSGENYEAIRGGTYDYGVIDEMAFLRAEAWPVIRPCFSVQGKKVLLISTPHIKNHFWDFYQLGLDQDEPNFTAIQAISIDNPYFPEEDLREAERTQPRDIVRQEYYAEFMEAGGAVFADLQTSATVTTELSKGREGYSYVFGIDWGAKNDKSILTIIEVETKRVVKTLVSHHKRYPAIVDQFTIELSKFKLEYGYAETNGVGGPTFDFLKDYVDSAQPFYLTNKNKREIVSSLRRALETGTIQIPTKKFKPELHRQLESYEIKKTSGGSVTYSHPSGMHDDHVDSLAIAWAAYTKLQDAIESHNVGLEKYSEELSDHEWMLKHGYNNNDNW